MYITSFTLTLKLYLKLSLKLIDKVGFQLSISIESKIYINEIRTVMVIIHTHHPCYRTRQCALGPILRPNLYLCVLGPILGPFLLPFSQISPSPNVPSLPQSLPKTQIPQPPNPIHQSLTPFFNTFKLCRPCHNRKFN